MITQRLRLPQVIKTIVEDACKLWEDQAQLEISKPSQVTHRLNGTHTLAIYTVYLASHSVIIQESLYTYITEWKNKKPTLTGHHLISKKLKPGPHFSKILTIIRDAWLDGKITTKDQESNLLDELINAYDSGGELSYKP
jgi:hypothetical protein